MSITQLNAQLQPSQKGLVPTNGAAVYFEVYGEGQPIILIHGAYRNIE